MPDIRRADVRLEKGDHGVEATSLGSALIDKLYGLYAYARNVTGASKVYSIFAAKPVQGDAAEAYSIYAEGDCKIQGTLDVVGEITKDGQSLAPAVFQRTITLTDAQIRSLPTVPVELIPAQGPNKIILAAVIAAKGEVNLRGKIIQPYTNIDVQASLFFYIGVTTNVAASYNNQNGVGLTLKDFLEYGPDGDVFWQLGPKDTDALNGIWNDTSQSVNAPLMFRIANGSNGDITGGDSNNSLSLTILYSVVDAS